MQAIKRNIAGNSISIALIAFLGFSVVSPKTAEAVCQLPAKVAGVVKLESGCVYPGAIAIEQSDTLLDCSGATIDAAGTRNGITVYGNNIQNVTISNCNVVNATNAGIFVKPPLNAAEMARLPLPDRYFRAPKRITISESQVSGSGTAGIYIGNYAQDTVIRKSVIRGSGSTGIYLDASSIRTTVTKNFLTNNGYGKHGDISRKRYREALAIDSSAHNTITNNTFSENAAGGIYIYKNCWEQHTDPKQAPRWQHSSFNLIRGNRFKEPVGIWIGSRQAKKLATMNCGDPPLAPGFFRDYADHNDIDFNTFDGGELGINIQDDYTSVTNNRFISLQQACVILGSELRDRLLGMPIGGTVLVDNTCSTAATRGYESRGLSSFNECEDNLVNGSSFLCGWP